MKTLLIRLVAVCALLACGSAFAQYGTPACPYYAINSSNGYSCFKTLSEAEDFLRADPGGDHPTRKYLEFSGSSVWMDEASPDLYYSVRPVSGTEGAPGYRLFRDGWNNYTSVACDLSGTTAQYIPSGSQSNCQNTPALCIYNQLCTSLAPLFTAITQYTAATTQCGGGSAWESASPSATPTGTGGLDNRPIYPPNTSAFQYGGGTVSFQYPTNAPTCGGIGGGILDEVKVTPVTCPAGYYFSPGTPLKTADACHSNEGGRIIAYRVPADAKQACPDSTCGAYGNPILPANGAKIQRPYGWNSDAMLGLNLVYNSASTDSTAGVFGGGWNSLIQFRYVGHDYYNVNQTFIDEEGNMSVFYNASSQYPFRSRGKPGSFMSGSTANGCEYTINEGRRRIITTCAGSDYHILRVEYPDSPLLNLTFDWAQNEIINAAGGYTQINNTVKSIRRADGKSLFLQYNKINNDAGCLISSYAFSCNTTRLVGIADDDGNLTVFDYNIEGRLSVIQYADGTKERFEYGAAEDLCPASMPGACTSSPNARMARSLLTGVFIDALQPDGTYLTNRQSTFQYDDLGRAIVSTHAGDAGRTEVSYEADYTPTVKVIADGSHYFKRRISAQRVSAFSKPALVVDSSPTGSVLRSMTNTYGANGYLSQSFDFKGVRTDWTYNEYALLTQKVEGANDTTGARRTTQYDWNNAGSDLLEVRVYNSATVLPGPIVSVERYAYNLRDQRVAECQVDPSISTAMAYACGSSANAPPSVRQTRYTFCESTDQSVCPLIGALLSVDGPRTDVVDVTRFEYSLANINLTKVTDATGKVTQFPSYDGQGRPLSTRDPNGVLTNMEYSPRGWLQAIKRRGADDMSEVDDAITRYEYDALGRVTSVTEPDLARLDFKYDSAGRLWSVQDSLGNKLKYGRNLKGNVVSKEVLDPSNALTMSLTRIFNDLGQMQSQIDAGNVATNVTYDLNGNADLTTDGLLRVFDSDVDPLNRLISTIANANGTGSERASASFKYDANSRLKSTLDPKGLTTAYSYNGLGDLISNTSPDTGVTSFGYDAAGNRLSQLDARGRTTTYVYDTLNRLISQSVPTAAQNVLFDYDTPQPDCQAGETFGAGRLARIRDESGSTRLCYDHRGNLVRNVQTVTGGSTLSQDHTYNGAGRLIAITYPSGAIVVYSRNANGQIGRVDAVPKVGAAQVTLVSDVSYLPFGPLNVLTLGNGRVLTKAYDANYGIDRVSDSATSNPISEDFTLNAVGNVTGLAERTSATATVSRIFGYDGLDRLTSQKNGTTNIESFEYDATGNRLKKTVGTAATTYTYPTTSHRLSSAGSVARNYDSNGNTTAIDTSNKGKTFIFDDRNRMRDLKVAGKLAASYRYNGKGERVLRTDSTAANSRQYVYDAAGHLLGEYTTAGVRIQEYVWLDDTLVAVLSDHDSSTYQLVEADHLGSPRAVIHPSKNTVIWRWDVNNKAFGEHLPNADPDGNRINYTLNLRFPGQLYDSASGLNYNYFRDYDAATGRYLESDPLGLVGGASTYAYVGASPLQSSDPYGLFDVYGRPQVTREDGQPAVQVEFYGPTSGLFRDFRDRILSNPLTPSGGATGQAAELGRYLQGQPTGVSDLSSRKDRKVCDTLDAKAQKEYEREFGEWNPAQTIGLDEFRTYLNNLYELDRSFKKYYPMDRMMKGIRERANGARTE